MEKLLNCALDIGEQMLICGGEVSRVEDSIKRICAAFGAKRTDVFIITSSIVVTICSENDHIFTQTRRIGTVGTDIERLHRLNELSRRVCYEHSTKVFDVEETKVCIDQIMNCEKYPVWMEAVSYSVIAGAFAIFFGGVMWDALVAAVIGMLLWCTVSVTNKILTNLMLAKFIGSFVITMMAFFASKFGVIIDVDKVIIGNIMALIPGIGLTNSIRDLFVGDSIAGILRFIEATLVALSIGAGYFLCMCFMKGYIL